jgi:glyoxylase-like metal-dependent hydrolase (beta-lactamase superfamily II)
MNNDRYEPLVLGAIATNCWIVPLDDSSSNGGALRPCAVIDPGDQANVIIARMERLHLYPRLILLTHGHFDHVAALPDLREAFSVHDPIIAIHREDAACLGPEAKAVHQASFTAAAGNSAYVDNLWKPLPAPTRLLNDGDVIGPFTVIHTPGHTPGSLCLWLENEKTLFSGDTLFRDGMGRTDLPGGDWPALQKSLTRLLSLDGDTAVYPGHGSATTIKRERQYGGS